MLDSKGKKPKIKRCHNCKKNMTQWITIVDATDYLSGYEDCRSPDRYICFSCFKDNLEKVSAGIDGSLFEAAFFHDVMFKFYPKKWEKYDQKD